MILTADFIKKILDRFQIIQMFKNHINLNQNIKKAFTAAIIL